MSEITGKQFSEPFKLRVVSGMLVDGSIQISWATGEKASSQMDWGLDPKLLSTTPEYHREPSEMVRYHTLYFPTTYLDARHYFRVRSKTISGKIGLSPIYSVITPDDVQTVNKSPFAEVQLVVTPIQATEKELLASITGSHVASLEPAAIAQHLATELSLNDNVQEHHGGTTSNARTNYITIIT